MSSWITICETCKTEDWQAGQGHTDGEALADLIALAAEGTGLRLRRHACLMGCARACNVAVQAPGKLSYTLGDFAPTEEAARAIVGWAALHAQSASGQVPYRDWPEGVKGHFVTRHPPLPA